MSVKVEVGMIVKDLTVYPSHWGIPAERVLGKVEKIEWDTHGCNYVAYVGGQWRDLQWIAPANPLDRLAAE